MLILSRKEDESIIIGNDIEVSVVDIKGDQVKLGIKAPKEIKVYRREVFTAIQKENLAAAKTGTALPDIGFPGDKKPQGKTTPASTPAASSGTTTGGTSGGGEVSGGETGSPSRGGSPEGGESGNSGT
jgi:carbon storage regulator